jgi:hypothetical protein
MACVESCVGAVTPAAVLVWDGCGAAGVVVLMAVVVLPAAADAGVDLSDS